MRLLCLAAIATALHGAQFSVAALKPNKVQTEQTTYKGKQGVRVTEMSQAPNDGTEDQIAILKDTKFTNGVIEAEIAGEPGSGAGQGARGFVGIAFRILPDVSKFECFYLRPTNGRAEDQVRRNHSVQYVSFPGFPWSKLRKEFPEMYESYVDLQPAEWTKLRIEVNGGKAKLFVHGAQQPTLIVNDLKHGPNASGSVGLWIGPGTVAHFANVRVTDSK